MKIRCIEYRAISHATEDTATVKKALENAGCIGPFQETCLTGVHHNRIVIITGEIKKQAGIKAFIRNLEEHGIMKSIESQIEERIDDDCIFHIRLSKQDAFNNRISLANDSDSIHISIHFSVFPSKKEKVIEELKRYYIEYSTNNAG